MHLLIEQVLVLTKDIFRRNEVRKHDLVVAFVELDAIAVRFCRVDFQNDRIGVSALADLNSNYVFKIRNGSPLGISARSYSAFKPLLRFVQLFQIIIMIIFPARSILLLTKPEYKPFSKESSFDIFRLVHHNTSVSIRLVLCH